MGRVRCHLESELSHQNICRATPITWGRIAHVVMIQCMEGEHTRRARTTPSAKNSIGHSSITVRGSDDNGDAKPKCNRAVLLVPGSITGKLITFPITIPHHMRQPRSTPIPRSSQGHTAPKILGGVGAFIRPNIWHCSAPVWKMTYKHLLCFSALLLSIPSSPSYADCQRSAHVWEPHWRFHSR
jgi:hypothetical protein